MNAPLRADYVLPLLWRDDSGTDELTDYLRTLSGWIAVTVVDGSPGGMFDDHHGRWSGFVRHVRPNPWPGNNGKVAGVMTGLFLVDGDRVVIADDDVRYDLPALSRIVIALDNADVVRPQNYFTSLPWHARWDTGRTLMNRALGADYPGTLAVRRELILAVGGYAGDVLFENLELIRTVAAAGGRVIRADDLFVGRMPPSVGHFVGQRVRQAYDDFAQPLRLVAELSLLPLALWALSRPQRLLGGVILACALGEYGRRRSDGASVFPLTGAAWVPLWMLERAICVWLAVGLRLLGGPRYGAGRLRRAATPVRRLRASREPVATQAAWTPV
ncbi:glycosyltransferase [Leifsonia sp. A12D58]|uniref:glycosyltransferase n=1 Tax=Leifsonia sp. A12D58 TaxID=3397674 RepID=UPI0039E116ED